MYSKTARTRKIFLQGAIVLLIFLAVFFLDVGWGDVVDRIVAIVNDEVITLTDVDIVLEFGLFEDLGRSQDEETKRKILDRLIDQKLVIQLASERIFVVEEELEVILSDIVQKTDPDLAERALLRFGLDWDDLKSYLFEKLLYQKVISQRFNRGVIVSIEEIESYYEQVYVPSQRENNLDPQPMIEVLDRLEGELQREKVEEQVRGWIENLKREADIRIITS